jgi:glc operon protein GlcG
VRGHSVDRNLSTRPGPAAQTLPKNTLSLAAAKKMAAAAEAAKNKWTMVIAVVDEGGHLIYLEHMDDAQIGSIDVAQGKARTAVRFQRPSRVFEDALAANHLGVMTLGDITAIRGGLPVHVTEYLACGLLIEIRRIVSAIDADHRAPSN